MIEGHIVSNPGMMDSSPSFSLKKTAIKNEIQMMLKIAAN